MALIGKIDNIPVFNTKNEALVWGRRNNLKGYHTQKVRGVLGYMGGSDHSEAKKKIKRVIRATSTVPTTPEVAPTAAPNIIPTTNNNNVNGGY